MKKISVFLMAAVLALSICACGSAPANSGSEIIVNWVSDNGDTKSLYWAGTYVAPTTTDEPYSWDSENDKEQTSLALLASGDDTKTFTYANGQLSYEASALGSTMTIRMEKVG